MTDCLSAQPAAPIPPEARLAIVIVNYESWPDVLRLVASLDIRGRVRVRPLPDRGRGQCVARARSPRRSPARRPGLRLVARPDNGGFAVGVNAGWRVSRSPWLLVLNPDVESRQSAFWARFWRRLDRYEADPERPARASSASDCEIPTDLRRARSASSPAWPGPSGSSSYRALAGNTRPVGEFAPEPVDWVTGACMLVNSAMIAELGGMDEDFFLYHEEVAFSRVARATGLAGRISIRASA